MSLSVRRSRFVPAAVTIAAALVFSGLWAGASLAAANAPWATKAGDTAGDSGNAVSALADGSSIVTGYFNDSATFGSTTLTSAGGNDVFVAKLDTAGQYVWATRAGGAAANGDIGHAVSALADGSSIITGHFDGAATFGSIALTSAGGRDVFVAKLDSDGNFVWATQAGGSDWNIARAVSTLTDGSSIVTGQFQGIATFGSTTLTSAGGNDVFVAKLDAAGKFVWAKSAGGASTQIGYGISTLADGSSIITGSFYGNPMFGSITLTSSEERDVFVAKLDADGNYVWATSAGGTAWDIGNDISTLADGSTIVTGYFAGTSTFGSTTLTSAVGQDVFVAKLDADGNYVWVTQAGGASGDVGRAISTVADGSAFVTGYFEGTATFGSTTLTSAGDGDVFVAKLDADGNYVWATSAGGTSWDSGLGVSSLADGSAIVTGYFADTTTFGSTTLTSAGSSDAFFAKFVSASAPAPPAPAPGDNPAPAPGDDPAPAPGSDPAPAPAVPAPCGDPAPVTQPQPGAVLLPPAVPPNAGKALAKLKKKLATGNGNAKGLRLRLRLSGDADARPTKIQWRFKVLGADKTRAKGWASWRSVAVEPQAKKVRLDLLDAKKVRKSLTGATHNDAAVKVQVRAANGAGASKAASVRLKPPVALPTLPANG
jgi:hypothetical protein